MLLSAILISVQQVNAQQQNNKEPRYIDVSGQAEMEIVPDEIYLSITLSEYEKNRTKINLDEIDRKFMEVITAMKIPKETLSLENVYGGMHWRRKKPETFVASKTYRLKLSTMAVFDELLDKLDEIGISNVYIQEATHSKLEEFKLKMKTDAVKAAQRKADKMAAAAGEMVERVLFINEINTENYYPQPIYNAAPRAMYKMSSDMAEANPASEVDFKKIKIRGEVTARFEIK